MNLSVPLSKLTPSKHNVRKSGGASIEDLAGSIQAHGLLQNLSVIEVDGKYQVVEACGKGAEKPLAKLSAKELAIKALALLQVSHWIPEELRPIAPPKSVAKKAAKKVAGKKAKAA